jgi:hypothetical protein
MRSAPCPGGGRPEAGIGKDRRRKKRDGMGRFSFPS